MAVVGNFDWQFSNLETSCQQYDNHLYYTDDFCSSCLNISHCYNIFFRTSNHLHPHNQTFTPWFKPYTEQHHIHTYCCGLVSVCDYKKLIFLTIIGLMKIFSSWSEKQCLYRKNNKMTPTCTEIQPHWIPNTTHPL